MTTYGQTILGPDGSVSVTNCETHEAAITSTTRMAINSGWRPPEWWQFWLPRWPQSCVEEYHRQTRYKERAND